MPLAASDSDDAVIGTSLSDGRYVIVGRLGTGSQGDTFEAVDKGDGRSVAIKRFLVRGARSWKDVELAEREARVLKELDHPLLPTAIDHFEQEGALYLVMEKVEGHSLAETGKLDQQEVRWMLSDLAKVLSYLHGRVPPVIHRDIKPGNVIRRAARPERNEQRPSFVLVDFGSVRDNLKPAGGSTVVGTFGYMAPEQFQGRALPASDVYGAGVTALTLLTGTQPESLPHRGLSIDVRAALQHVDDPTLVATLQAMVDPNPDKRANQIGPLLESLNDGPPSSSRPAADKARQRKPTARRRQRRARKREREEKRSRKRSRVRRTSQRPPNANPSLPPIIAFVFMLGLVIARFSVSLSMRVIVPLVLTSLSILFGKALRQAAREVRAASRQVDETLENAQQWVRGQPQQSRKRFGASKNREKKERQAAPRRARIETLDDDHDARYEREYEMEEEVDSDRVARRD